MKSIILLIGFLGCLAYSETTPKSSKKLDFDGEIIEGVNKQPLDSLEHISETDGALKRVHLYKIRKDFKGENTELVREIAETLE